MKTNVTREQFTEWYDKNPSSTVDEIMEEFDIKRSTAYMKIKQYHQRKPYHPESTEIGARIYQDGFDKGLLIGSGLGVLLGDLAKSKGIGVSDLLQKLVESLQPAAAPVNEGI